MCKFRNLEIESRVVNQNHYIRIPLYYILLAEGNVSQQLPGLDEYFNESDDCPVLVMADKCLMLRPLILIMHGLHQVSSPESDVCLPVFRIYAFHQI